MKLQFLFVSCELYLLCSSADNVSFIFKQVLIRLIGADEQMYMSNADAMHWIEDTNVLEMIVDKFSSSVSSINFLIISEDMEWD